MWLASYLSVVQGFPGVRSIVSRFLSKAAWRRSSLVVSSLPVEVGRDRFKHNLWTCNSKLPSWDNVRAYTRWPYIFPYVWPQTGASGVHSHAQIISSCDSSKLGLKHATLVDSSRFSWNFGFLYCRSSIWSGKAEKTEVCFLGLMDRSYASIVGSKHWDPKCPIFTLRSSVLEGQAVFIIKTVVFLRKNRKGNFQVTSLYFCIFCFCKKKIWGRL